MTGPTPGVILITGAAGFIGSHVAVAARRAGARVVGVDNFDGFYAEDRKRANLAEAGLVEGETFHRSDITDDAALGAIFDRVRPAGVIHLAGKAGVRPSLQDPAGYMHANATGTARVLVHASRVGASRVVIASSSSVYGNSTPAPFREDHDVSRPISPYAASKRACELLAHAHHHATGLPVALLRFFTVYGPRQRPDLAIAMFLRKVALGEEIRLFGDASRTARDYTFVDDTVQGVLRAYERIPALGFRVWNLGNSSPVTLETMVRAVERVVGKSAVVRREGMQTGDVDLTCADMTRSREELGYDPRVPFEEGLSRQWAWTRETLRAEGRL